MIDFGKIWVAGVATHICKGLPRASGSQPGMNTSVEEPHLKAFHRASNVQHVNGHEA